MRRDYSGNGGRSELDELVNWTNVGERAPLGGAFLPHPSLLRSDTFSIGVGEGECIRRLFKSPLGDLGVWLLKSPLGDLGVEGCPQGGVRHGCFALG